MRRFCKDDKNFENQQNLETCSRSIFLSLQWHMVGIIMFKKLEKAWPL